MLPRHLRHLREELEQQVLCNCWLARRNCAPVIHSRFAYLRKVARRALASLLRRDHPSRLRFDDDIIHHCPAPSAVSRGRAFDIEAWRTVLKALLDERQSAVYECHFEQQLGIRATARACDLDPTQVYRCIREILALARHGAHGMQSTV